MAKCKVLKATDGWNVGDTIEASGARLEELVKQGVVEVTEPDKTVEPKQEEAKKPSAHLGELKQDPIPGNKPWENKG